MGRPRALVLLPLLVWAISLAVSSSPAEASPDTLRRSFANLLQGPLDVALAPVSAGIAVDRSLPNVADTPLERAFYPLPGYLGLTCLQIAIGGLRTIAGALQLLPGLVLLPFEADLGPELDVFSGGWALVEWGPFVKFGVVSPAAVYDGKPEERALEMAPVEGEWTPEALPPAPEPDD